MAWGIVLLLSVWSNAGGAREVVAPTSCPAVLSAEIPAREPALPAGSEFARSMRTEAGAAREAAIATTLLSGNLPDFLRRLKAVRLSARTADGRVISAVLCVMPDYLAIGSNRDYLRMPMDLPTAIAVARRFGFVLPTARLVDAIYAQADVQLAPQPMQPGPRMRSTDYYVRHNAGIANALARTAPSLAALVAGHKKDLVLSNRLASHPGRVAIYGWHRTDGRPIQPLSTVHGEHYADYSHGIRLVSEVVLVDGEPTSIYRVLSDPELATLLSNEGPIPLVNALIAAAPRRLARLEHLLLASNSTHSAR